MLSQNGEKHIIILLGSFINYSIILAQTEATIAVMLINKSLEIMSKKTNRKKFLKNVAIITLCLIIIEVESNDNNLMGTFYKDYHKHINPKDISFLQSRSWRAQGNND